VFVLDRDGVIVCRAVASAQGEDAAGLSSIYTTASHHANKLLLGENSSITVTTGARAVTHAAWAPLTICVVAQVGHNTGVASEAIVQEIKTALEPIRFAIKTVQ
jgi:hypothetical protein